MIVLTTGTNEQPFDRLVEAAARLDGPEPIFVQHGSSQVAHGRGTWVDFLPFDELAERMREARVVVCHAGVGSVFLARRCGHRPIVLPRRLHLGEAVDDHQLELGRRLHAAGIVTLVENADELVAAVAAAEPGAASTAQTIAGAASLAADLRTHLERLSIAPHTLNHQVGAVATRGVTVGAR
jgi:UDP-N-acetylglucosamine transferase subunit ALG13